MTGSLWLAAVQPADGSGFPTWELLGIAALVAGVLLILIRSGLRKPPELATTDEIKMLTGELARFREELQALERDYKAECASRKDVEELGKKVDRIDNFHLSLHDRTGQAANDAARALGEVAQLRQDIGAISRDVRETRDAMIRLESKLTRGDA